MSAPLDDLMGNSLTEPISDMSEDSPDVEVSVVDDRPEEDQVAPRDDERAQGFDPDEEIADVGGRAGKRIKQLRYCLLYTSPSPRDQRGSRMPSSA